MLKGPQLSGPSLAYNEFGFENAVQEFHKNRRGATTSPSDEEEYGRTLECETSSDEGTWDTDLEDALSGTESGAEFEENKGLASDESDTLSSRFIADRLNTSSARLSHGVLRAHELRVLAEALVLNTCVKSLDLRGNSIDHTGMRELHEMLIKNKHITDLNLADNHIGKKGSKYIGQILQESKALEVLNVSGNALGDARAFEIARGLIASQGLKKINLSHNHFMSAAGKEFGLAIELNQSVVELDLSWNHLRLQGAKDLSKSVAWNKSIRILNLSFNGFSDCGAEAMGRALAINDTLRSLDLSYNRISDAGCNALCKGLSKNKSLEILKIGYNPITETGSMVMIKAVRKAVEINEILMDEIYVEEEAINLIQDIMNQRPNFRASYRGIARGSGRSPSTDLATVRKKIFAIVRRFLRSQNLRMLDLFNKWDRDKTMQLSPDEFVAGFREAKIALSQDMLDVLISTLDKNGDGEISYSEFVAATKIT